MALQGFLRPFRSGAARAIGVGAVLLAIFGSPVLALHPTEPPNSGNLSFTVFRNGEEIGTQTLKFLRDDERLTVRTTIDIEVKVAFITAYRFHMKAEEVWEGDQLVEFSSRTDDDGTPRNLLVKAKQEGQARVLAINANGARSEAPGSALPASMWNPRMLQQTVLLDVMKGRLRKVRVADKGEETIKVGGRPVTAHHYAVRGQLVRDVWYGPDGHIVKFAFPHTDGSEIVFERNR